MDTSTQVPAWDTEELHADAQDFVGWLLDACERKSLPHDVIARRLDHRAEMRKLIHLLERNETARRREIPGCVFTALERLDARNHGDSTRWQSAVSRAYALRVHRSTPQTPDPTA